MFNVKVQRTLNVPSARVWNVLKDFGGHYRFNPYFESSPICNGIPEGLGSEREVKFYDGPVIKQKVIDYEEGHMILVGISGSTWPIKRGWTRITLDDAPDDHCELAYHLQYTAALGPLSPLVGLYFKPVFTSHYNIVLRGVEHFVITGEKLLER